MARLLELVVNPYLEATDHRTMMRLMSDVDDQEMRAEFAARTAADDLAAFVDAPRRRAFVTTAAEGRLLAAMNLNRASIPEIRATHPTLVDVLVDAGLLVTVGEVRLRHHYRCVEIEINRHCNLRCEFCPVATDPKPKGFMQDAVFALAVNRALEYGAGSISLNHYSEPTLHPSLIDKICFANGRGLKIRLHTNASLFDEDKIARLATTATSVVVNLPSADKAEYERITRAKTFDRVVRNLELLHAHGVSVRLSINAPRDVRDATTAAINERFASMFGDQVAWRTDGRAGLLERSEYATQVRFGRALLSGCDYAASQINVAYDGRVFLCCQDFNQEYVLGDIATHSLKEIAECDRACDIRGWILGLEAPPDRFICSSCSWTTPKASDGALGFGGRERDADINIQVAEIVFTPWRIPA